MSLQTASSITKIVVMTMIVLGVSALVLMDVRGVMHNGAGIQDAAVIDGERITTRDVDTRAEMMAQKMGVPRDKIDGSGIKEYVLQGLIAQKLAEKALNGMGLRFSDKAVAEELRQMLTDPQNPNADLAQRYEMMLRQSGQSRKEFEDNLRTEIAKRIVDEALAASLLPDPLLAHAKAARAAEKRDLAVITVTPSVSKVKGEPSAEVVQDVYEANKAAFTTPEKRSGRVFSISQDALTKLAGKDGDAQETLTEIEDAFFGGEKPEEIAKQYGLAVEKTITDMSKPEGDYGAALFDLEAGEVSSALPLSGDKKGFAFVVLDSVTEAKPRPMQDVKPQIVTLWREQQAVSDAKDLIADIKVAQDPISVAQKGGAEVVTLDGESYSEDVQPLFDTATLGKAVELPSKDQNEVKLGVVKRILRGTTAAWKPVESPVKDFQLAQSQSVEDVFYRLITPFVAKAKIELNQSAIVGAPLPPQ